MKKIFTLIAICLAGQIMAQDSTAAMKKDTTYWTKVGFIGLNASQTSVSDWSGGGQDNYAINAVFNFEANYKKEKHEWTNKLDAQYGIIKTGSSRLFKKNIDQLFALSKYNINAFGKHWYYAAQVDYRTQFAPGYKYSGDVIEGQAISDMNSPGYIQLALGLDYKPKDYFSITIAPAAGKITLVNRQYLADAGAYDVEKAVYDENGVLITHGKKMRTEFGGRVIVKFKKDIFKNVNLDSYLDLFSNYGHNPGNIDVVFNNMLTVRLAKYFTVNIISQVLYDDDIIRKRDLDNDGLYDKPGEINGPRLQLMSTFAIGFGYKF
ncbi:DUF3078 domain-containing protein [Aurantibacillus circumpalustris]|uniref:DUF3078 domain-containing protein n=1 Tax=Aurantibacillus circumpalustris TaxID=3036359 RepID=UPI00295C0D00|nr:DUF3078 domain-containing protein [Aurantibacillus circumpalustris]